MIYLKYLTTLITQIVLVVAFSAGMVSCRHDNGDEPKNPDEQEPTTVGRTVLVYMFANSDLTGYDTQDLKEMCDAAAAGDIVDGRLLVFHSAINGKQVLKEITQKGAIDTLKVYDTEVIPQMSQRMSEVLDDMKTLAPADDYGMVLWGHGSGWLEDGIVEDDSSLYQTYAFGMEQNGKWRMNITSLARVLEGEDISFLHFDCCYMASVETIYQLRNVARRIVAYPTEILGWGMPYDRTIKYYFKETPDLEGAAMEIFDFYQHIEDNVSPSILGMRPDTYRMCTVSVFDTKGLDRLAAATRAIYQQNTIGVPANYTPQSYTTSGSQRYYYCDFGGYVNALKPESDKLAEFQAALDDVVLLEMATEKIWGSLTIREHSGFSTFIMNSEADKSKLNYSRLDWFNDVASTLIH